MVAPCYARIFWSHCFKNIDQLVVPADADLARQGPAAYKAAVSAAVTALQARADPTVATLNQARAQLSLPQSLPAMAAGFSPDVATSQPSSPAGPAEALQQVCRLEPVYFACTLKGVSPSCVQQLLGIAARISLP